MVKIKRGAKKTSFLKFKRYFLVFSLLISLVFSCFLFIQTVSAHTLAADSSTQEIKIDVPDTGPTDLQTIFNNIWNILFGAAAIVAVIVIIWGGYQYMTSGGGEGAEKAKKTIIGAIIGLIIIISAVAIVNFVIAIMDGKLKEFSGNLFDNNSSTAGTSGTGGSSGTNSPTNPVATPAGTDVSKISGGDQAAKDYCKSYEQETIKCYVDSATFLAGTTCGTDNLPNLNDKAKEACQGLATYKNSLTYVTSPSKETINGKSVDSTRAFAGCYDSYVNGTKIKGDCNNIITNYKDTIASGSTTTPAATTTPTTTKTTNSTTPAATTTPTTTTQSYTPYQQCIKDAQTKYNSCRNQLGQACYSQQSAYKACLTDAVYYIFRLFNSKYCDKVKQTYNKCQSDWQTNCSNALSRAQESCRLNYPTVY